EGKYAVVTGASRGIGLAIADSLATEGAHVVAAARNTSGELARLAAGLPVHPVRVDLGTADGPARLVDAVMARFGALDILVNNVGSVRPRPAGFLSIADEDWMATLTINLLAAIRTTRAALPHLLARGAGTIVTICSVNAFLPDPLVIDYGVAKGALANFCKALSKEVGPRGIRVNMVSPGPVATDLWLGKDGVAETVARAGGIQPDSVAQRAALDSVTGRFTRPKEVADLVVFLAGDRAANVTGADFVIDGGMTATL
ncbi:MAG TPA: oxidoreductase, partial [Candidatus Dormibacteraeota bacterium]|nr:oxidoreductase [Candidatus Dormibacteraeota bacterium]